MIAISLLAAVLNCVVVASLLKNPYLSLLDLLAQLLFLDSTLLLSLHSTLLVTVVVRKHQLEN